MDRNFYYPNEQLTDVSLLTAERQKLIGLAYLSQAVLGTGPIADGFACIPTVPATLAVQIGNGSLYSLQNLDSTAFGTLGVDTTDLVVKQGIALTVPNLTLTPPSTSGYAINYLIEVAFVESDTGSSVLSYYNSTSPSVPYSGPNGLGTSQPTVRQDTVTFTAKAGTAATAGTQTTPSPDSGYVGLWVVTVANGQTQIVAGNISQYSAAPFISQKLPVLPAWVQSGSWAYAVDTGTANAMAISLTPTPTSPPASIFVKKIAAANTGAMNITIAGLGTYSLINPDASAIPSGEMTANYFAHLGFDGTSYRFLNWTSTTGVGSLTANGGVGITVNGSATVSLNFPGLGTENTINSTDLFGFYSQADATHRTTNWSNLITKLQLALGISTAATVDGNMIVGSYAGAAPSNTLGLNGDYAFDVSSGKVFGPKASSVWPATAAYTPPTSVGVATSASFPIGSTLSGYYSGITQSGGATLGVVAYLGNGALTVASVSGSSSTPNTATVTMVGGGVVVMNGPNAYTNIVAGQVWRGVGDYLNGYGSVQLGGNNVASYASYQSTIQRIG